MPPAPFIALEIFRSILFQRGVLEQRAQDEAQLHSAAAKLKCQEGRSKTIYTDVLMRHYHDVTPEALLGVLQPKKVSD